MNQYEVQVCVDSESFSYTTNVDGLSEADARFQVERLLMTGERVGHISITEEGKDHEF